MDEDVIPKIDSAIERLHAQREEITSQYSDLLHASKPLVEDAMIGVLQEMKEALRELRSLRAFVLSHGLPPNKISAP
ncbi:MAG: hypothetical protein HY033_11680 [Ignavibacteriae bacterium]|nr:hypothetical protein [Ignavibacteria bacterium]MBI3365558.1 hypothetical protein [Ignavibacteriota bacterium]